MWWKDWNKKPILPRRHSKFSRFARVTGYTEVEKSGLAKLDLTSVLPTNRDFTSVAASLNSAYTSHATI